MPEVWNVGRPSRDATGYSRGRTGAKQAYIFFPPDFIEYERAEIEVEGSTLKVRPCADGRRKISKVRNSDCRRLCVPLMACGLFPFGSGEVDVVERDGLLIIDTKQFQQIAAE